MLSLLFNRDFYNSSYNTNKELAIQSIDSKLDYNGNGVGFVRGYIFDFKRIGGPTEDDLKLFKQQSDEKVFAIFKEVGRLEEFKNEVRDRQTDILDIYDEDDYENFIIQHCFTNYDYESFLEEHNLEDVGQFVDKYAHVILIQEIQITESHNNVGESQVIELLKETLVAYLDMTDYVLLDSNYTEVVLS